MPSFPLSAWGANTFEVIVVDHDSKDGSCEVIKHLEIV